MPLPCLLLLVIILCLVMAAEGAASQPVHRPDFARAEWIGLNGDWQFALDPEEQGEAQQWPSGATDLPLTIRVPFGWESPLSGVCRPDYKGVAWYRRTFALPEAWAGRRWWLCFGAVDYRAQVWVNGQAVGEHEGGYGEFRLEISQAAQVGENVVVVRAEDRTSRETPIGKQVRSWYTSTSGIWQNVWLEATGPACFNMIRLTPQAGEDGAPSGDVLVEVQVDRGQVEGRLGVEAESPEGAFTKAVGNLGTASSYTVLMLRVPDPKFWSPDSPHLYPVRLRVRSASGQVCDEVDSYFGLRTVDWGPYGGSDYSYVLLNGKPIYLCGALDQSFNPEGVYTAPDDDFMRRDIESAKAAGLNMLRIHIKAEEPRRLYWADRLGMLIQADIPCVYDISERARATFEAGMREQIARDLNHPAIYCWTVFNEEWGIGSLERAPREHRVDWVESMVSAARGCDPTRLVQDNTGWSHLVSDLNSFHWYGRDVDGFREHYREIDGRVGAGSDWNYIAGRRSRGEPFVNNEYGYVSAGAGDGDSSWGTLFATNAMRACPRLVGYTYTELSDIEWEHNGIYNYDRSPKEFGFDFWAPGMGVRDVFARDFLVLDVPAVKWARVGEEAVVPAVFSHYSGEHAYVTLKYRVRWLDTLGRMHEEPVQSRACPRAQAYRLTDLGEIRFTLPGPGLVTLAAWLEDEAGGRLHTNYTQWVVGMDQAPARAEALDTRTVALRFNPEDWCESTFAAPEEPREGKVSGRGTGRLEYRLRIPDKVPLAALAALTLVCEVGAHGSQDKLDWPARSHPEDYPQTDGRKSPTTVRVSVNGAPVSTWLVPDDPADARGVLSHWAGWDRGSYGFRLEAECKDAAVLKQVAAGRTLIITLEVPPGQAGGLRLYGRQMGTYPLDPTVLLRFTRPHRLPKGWQVTQPVAEDRYWGRVETILPTAREGATAWRYATAEPAAGWELPSYDDVGWAQGKAGFGTEGIPGAVVGTRWDTGDIWLRARFTVADAARPAAWWLSVHHDEGCEIYLNGSPLWREGGYLNQYRNVALGAEQVSLLREGENVLAVHCRHTSGGQFVDVGLRRVPESQAKPAPARRPPRGAQRVTRLQQTRWTIGGKPILGTYLAGADRMADLRAVAEAGMNVVLAGEAELDPGTPAGAFCREHGIRVLHHLTQYLYHGAKLRDPVTPEQTTIPLYFAHGVPAQESRVVQIDDEIIRYEAMTEQGLTGCRRGCDGTRPAAHREGVILFWPEPCAAEVAKVKDSPNLFGYYVLDDSPGDAMSALRALYRTVQRVDPGGRHPVCAGFGDAGSVVNLGPETCDIMLIYWYPVGGAGYDRERTSQEVQRMLTTARRRVPGIPFAGVYQAFDGAPLATGQGVPSAAQLREQLEDFVREGACGLVAFVTGAKNLPGWVDLPDLGAAVREANREILATGGLVVRPEPASMRRGRLQPAGHWARPRPVPGVVPAWYVVGPFQDTEGKRLEAGFGPDEGFDAGRVYPVKFGSARWRARETTCGVLGLTNLYGDQKGVEGCLAYAYCEITSPKRQVVQMHICSDDDARVLLNGKEVYRFEGGRGLDYNLDVVKVTLPAGKSRLLVKIYNRVGMWGLNVRFMDAQGKPLDGLEFSPGIDEGG